MPEQGIEVATEFNNEATSTKSLRTDSLSEHVNMDATCTPRKWTMGISIGIFLFLVVITLGITLPMAAAGVEDAKLAVDLCAGYNCTDKCPCRSNSTCTSTLSSPAKAVCVAGPVVPDGTSCDDGDSSTMQDTCRAGVCRGEPLTCAGVDCSGPNYGFDACHGVAKCELSDGAVRCVPHRYDNGYDCSRGLDRQMRCWKGNCLELAEYEKNVARDPCRNFACPDTPELGPQSCRKNGTGSCYFDGTNLGCGYAPEEVNTPCVANNTAGRCDAFGNCRTTENFRPTTCVE